MTAKMRNSKDYPVEHGPRQGETIIFLHGGFVAIELIRRHPPLTHTCTISGSPLLGYTRWERGYHPRRYGAGASRLKHKREHSVF